MDRSFAAAASEPHEPVVTQRTGLRRDAELARRVGTAVHAFLEQFDFDADFAAELERGRRTFVASLCAEGPADPDGPAVQEGVDRLERIVAGKLFERLRALSPCVVARELPVLLPPGGSGGPVGYTSGAIDLVYRDDEDLLVVADYKTDDVAGAALGERARRYAGQGEVYQRAVRDALGLSYTPRFELWFLAADRVVQLPATDVTPVQLGIFH